MDKSEYVDRDVVLYIIDDLVNGGIVPVIAGKQLKYYIRNMHCVDLDPDYVSKNLRKCEADYG